jgi:hypothetical protein
MTKSRRVGLDEALAPGSYRLLILELAFKDERDLPGLVRYRLEGLLPRGLEGLRHCFRRIGRTGRFLVTLIKEPLPESFAVARTALPFPLRIDGRGGRRIDWISHNATYAARYEEGLLASVEVASGGAIDRSDGPPPEAAPPERRDAIASGPGVQEAVGRTDAAWKIAAAALGLALAAQLALGAARAVEAREARLDSLNERIAELTALGGADSVRTTAPDLGLQARADEIQRSVSSRWRPGSYLVKWSLAADKLRLEGWGPDALALLASLRADPALVGLELASRADEKGYESFAFEGKVADD